jgi:hypothetical protein
MENLNILSETLEVVNEIDYLMLAVSMFMCLLSSFTLMYVYKIKANSLSSKSQIAKIIPLLANITFLVILIVKSSLALSLGLVGALSVIRFRTPVKEPEDLAYLFLAIALGIGYGALQIFSTSVVFIVLILIIWFFLSVTKNKIEKSFNLVIEYNADNNKDYFDRILTLLKENSQDVQIVKIEKSIDTIMLFYIIHLEKIDEIKSLTEGFEAKFKQIKFSLYENQTIG